MRPDPNPAVPDPTDEPRADLDPAELKRALGRTGRMLKTAGLPFELDEFDQDDEADADEGGDAPAAADDDPPQEADLGTAGDELKQGDRAPGDAGGPPA